MPLETGTVDDEQLGIPVRVQETPCLSTEEELQSLLGQVTIAEGPYILAGVAIQRGKDPIPFFGDVPSHIYLEDYMRSKLGAGTTVVTGQFYTNLDHNRLRKLDLKSPPGNTKREIEKNIRTIMRGINPSLLESSIRIVWLPSLDRVEEYTYYPRDDTLVKALK